jgi:hypothetical protein
MNKTALLPLIVLIALSFGLAADEGMWTFDNPPVKQLQEKYGFTPTPEWLGHLRLSSVRFGDGGSGSFVSPTGLALTNHHVALSQLQKVSTPAKNYVRDGFYAQTTAEELKCPDLELNVLISMENVTPQVLGAVKPGMSDAEALKARRAEMARIQKESLDKTGLRSDVVSLYHGGEYWLYRYKKYTDVRLVFAPEQQAAFYGGDPDNFTYPRYDLDLAVFRVYENGKPLANHDYLKWNSKGAAEGELVFVSGHPGRTSRLLTLSQLEFMRDYTLPQSLASLKRRLAVLRAYSQRGPEQARQAGNQIFGAENSLKRQIGQYAGLLDKSALEKKAKEEREFRQAIAARPEWQRQYGAAFEAIAQAQQKSLERQKESRYRGVLGGTAAGSRGGRLPTLAASIVEYVAEVRKPDAERLEGFHESQLDSLRFRLLSPAPVYPGLEEAQLADALAESLEGLGPNDPFIKAVLNGRSPADVARELIAGTKLAEAGFRKSLLEGGPQAVEASTDPLIVAARKIDPMTRELRKWSEDNVQSRTTSAGEKIGQARFAVYGRSSYPDCTFTLRLSYGTVKGYAMNGTVAPYKTTFFGLYDRSASFDDKAPFNLPARIAEGRTKIDLSTPVDFVTTNDVVGGNSGSPIVNRNAEIIGLVFDGNIEGLVGDYVYNIENNRTVAVHTAGMIEALRKLYGAGALADELEGRK